MTVWCKGFLKAHAALWKPAVRWALSAGGVKAGFVGRHRLLFTKDNYRERNGLGGSVPPHSSRSRHLFLANSKVRPSPFTANGRWGWRPCRGERVLGYPSRSCVAPRTRDPHFVWPGATRRCFALLGAFPARRDEALRGALGVGGDGRGGVRVGSGLASGAWVLLCL